MTSHLETSQVSEQAAEYGIIDSLARSPFYRVRQSSEFDAATLLDVAETTAFIKATQPRQWDKLSKQFAGEEDTALAGHLTTLIQKRGTLEVLRNGVSFSGINLLLAYFRPSADGNPEHQARYEGNRFAVMRQVHFSTKMPDQSIDVVILLNGLPIVSMELKNHFTCQNVQHAIAQYRRRDKNEPFWRRCLVHFAVDDDAAYMTTRLAGPDTAFLPFNRDTHNPIIPGRFASSYLWDDFIDEDGEVQPGTKDKTLELFGVKDTSVKKGFRPFHQYTMSQAIAEGFILDVLESYTTYKTYFELIETEKADGEKEVEKLKARRLMLQYVDRHEFAIRRKAHIIVDHFTRNTAHKISGQAKAMVVTHSRAHAVLYKRALDEVVREQNLSFGVLVAFSGTVIINEQKYTEENMNPPGAGDIAEAFKNPAKRLLVVANKFQTGFDQPLLHTMYVDKKLGGVAAVQTLSRLNRTFPPFKQDTMVLDFVNEQETIQASFQDYYQRTELEGATNPNKLYNLRYTLEKMGVFTPEDVAEFVELFVVKKVKSKALQSFFQRIVQNGYENLAAEYKGTKDYEKKRAEAKDKFRKGTARYVKQYSFISQIMTFTDTSLEKFYLFAKLLLRQLPYEKQTLPLEVIEMIDMDKYRAQEEQNGRITLKGEDGVLKLTPDDGYRGGEAEKEKIKLIIQKLNEDYGVPFEEADRVMNAIKQKLEEDDSLRAAFKTSDIDHLRRDKLNRSIKDAFLSNADEFLNFMAKIETDSGFGKFFFSEMFNWYLGTIKSKN